MCALAILSEWFEVSLYGETIFSVSVTMVFAAALLQNMLGVAAVSLAIALTHYLRNHKTLLHQFAFKLSMHVLAGTVPVIVFGAATVPLSLENLISLSLLTILASCAFFGVETGLVSVLIGILV